MFDVCVVGVFWFCLGVVYFLVGFGWEFVDYVGYVLVG